jgi:hypothetical protein
MTELMFPAGIVRIDEGHVWAELSRWTSGGDRRVRMASFQGVWSAVLEESRGPVITASWDGSSRLSLADAVAQALQTAIAAGGRAA